MAISVNELRAGNWCNYRMRDYEGGRALQFQVGNILPGLPRPAVCWADRTREPPYFLCEYLEGISLTPEILEACGFSMSPDDRGDYWHCGNFCISPDAGYIAFTPGKQDEGRNYYSNPIGYLHTLQNLYFALTNCELEVNIPVQVPA